MTITANPRMLGRNLADEGTLSALPALLTTLPVTNLQTQGRETARTTILASQAITWVLDADQVANMVALGRHNLTTGGTYRIQVYSDAAATAQIADSGTLAAFSTAALSPLDAGRYLEDEFRGRKNIVFYFARLTTVRAVKLTLTDASNPDGYMEASRLFIGEYTELYYAVATGSEGGTSASLSTQGRSDGGDLWSDRGVPFAKQTFSTEFIDDENDLAEVLALIDYLGTFRDFWWDAFPGDTSAWALYRRGQRKFTNDSALDARNYGLHSTAWSMEEP